jgi:hypothetical protein
MARFSLSVRSPSRTTSIGWAKAPASPCSRRAVYCPGARRRADLPRERRQGYSTQVGRNGLFRTKNCV